MWVMGVWVIGVGGYKVVYVFESNCSVACYNLLL